MACRASAEIKINTALSKPNCAACPINTARQLPPAQRATTAARIDHWNERGAAAPILQQMWLSNNFAHGTESITLKRMKYSLDL